MTLRQSLIINFHIFLILVCCTQPGIQAKPDPYYTTCDLDLEDIEALLQYLPSICTEIYNKRTSDGGRLYDSYLAESEAFAKFHQKLSDYELRSQRNQQEAVELEVYPFEAELRRNIYQRNDLIVCVESSNGTANNFLNCVTDKHSEMEKLVLIEAAKLE